MNTLQIYSNLLLKKRIPFHKIDKLLVNQVKSSVSIKTPKPGESYSEFVLYPPDLIPVSVPEEKAFQIPEPENHCPLILFSIWIKRTNSRIVTGI